MRLAYALTATDMRMRENDVTLGIPKTSYRLDGIIDRSKHPSSLISAFVILSLKTILV